MRTRKLVTVEVTVSAPIGMSAAEIRKELRHMQGGWSLAGDDIKVRSVRPVSKKGY